MQTYILIFFVLFLLIDFLFDRFGVFLSTSEYVMSNMNSSNVSSGWPAFLQKKVD